jgi:hypothetical protein
MHKYEYLKDVPLFSTIVVLFFGLWGAILNFSRREQDLKERSLTRKIMMFFVDLLTSSGFAILTFYGCMGYGVNEVISVAIAGIVSHQGTRAIYIAELLLASKFGGNTVVEAIKEKEEKK